MRCLWWIWWQGQVVREVRSIMYQQPQQHLWFSKTVDNISSIFDILSVISFFVSWTFSVSMFTSILICSSSSDLIELPDPDTFELRETTDCTPSRVVKVIRTSYIQAKIYMYITHTHTNTRTHLSHHLPLSTYHVCRAWGI